MTKTPTIVRMDRDGVLRKVGSDGAMADIITPAPIREMSDAEIEAAAAADPDSPPLTPERLARLKPAPRVRTLRRALGLTQEEFSARYEIPLGALRDWEQDRSQPDQTARAYLKVIAGYPEGVLAALRTKRA